ncbi:MAG TPA: hypothetical protein VD926_03545 [Acidimicrobiales bacterium]|nr:hypothetical protein [Acidimicrobiales bacterium]
MASAKTAGRTSTLGSLIPTARRRAITDGLFGGDRKWLLLGGMAWALRAYQYATTKDEKVVYSTTLQPGETLVLARQAPKNKGRKRS